MVEPGVTSPIAYLREVKLLSRFTESELQNLLDLGEVQNFEPHSNIVIEGELTWGIYLILEGTVGILKMSAIGGNVYEVGHLKSGSFFGEMSLIDDHPRSATVKALSECRLLYISKEKFNEFIKGSPSLQLKFYEACVQTLVSRLRVLDDSYVISQYQLWKTVLTKDSEEVA